MKRVHKPFISGAVKNLIQEATICMSFVKREVERHHHHMVHDAVPYFSNVSLFPLLLV